MVGQVLRGGRPRVLLLGGHRDGLGLGTALTLAFHVVWRTLQLSIKDQRVLKLLLEEVQSGVFEEVVQIGVPAI